MPVASHLVNASGSGDASAGPGPGAASPGPGPGPGSAGPGPGTGSPGLLQPATLQHQEGARVQPDLASTHRQRHHRSEARAERDIEGL